MSKRFPLLSPLRSLALLLPVFASTVYFAGKLHYQLPAPVTESSVQLHTPTSPPARPGRDRVW